MSEGLFIRSYQRNCHRHTLHIRKSPFFNSHLISLWVIRAHTISPVLSGRVTLYQRLVNKMLLSYVN